MSKNIEININTGGTYEALYPTTSMSNVTGTLPIANGGTNATSASSSVYNLTQPLSSRTAANLNSYASSTYIPCYYSTIGYKFPLSNIMKGFEVITWAGTGNEGKKTLNFPQVQGKTGKVLYLSTHIGFNKKYGSSSNPSYTYDELISGGFLYLQSNDMSNILPFAKFKYILTSRVTSAVVGQTTFTTSRPTYDVSNNNFTIVINSGDWDESNTEYFAILFYS